jgi:hypothetical protein
MQVDTGAFRVLTGRLEDLEQQVRQMREDSAIRDALIRAGQAIESEIQDNPAAFMIQAGRLAERARRQRRGGHLRPVDGGA